VTFWSALAAWTTRRARAESETRDRSLIELSSDFFWETDAEHRYTAIELGREYRGVRNNGSKLGLARWDIPYASPDASAWAAHRAAIAARERFVDFRFSRIENGEERFYEHSGEPRYDSLGRFLGYRGVGRDVTERRRAEEALRQSEGRYERAMSAAEAGFWDWDVAHDEFYVSPRLLRMGGFPPGTTFASRADFMRRAPFHPEDRDSWQQAVKALFASGDSRLAQELRVIIGGETRWYRLDGMCFRDAAGRVVRWAGSSIDVTDRRLAEEALRGSEERYARAMEATEAGHWEWDLVTHQVFHSPRFRELYGIPPDETFANREAWKARQPVSPSERERQERALQAAIADPTKTYDIELSFEIRPGEVRWLRSRAKVFRAEDGRPLRVTGATTDITAQKLAQEALRESQERYALAVAGADDGVWDCDFASRRVFVSARGRELAGMPSGPDTVPMEEFFAGLPLHPEDVARRTAAFQAHLAGETPAYVGEFRLRQADGVYRWRRLRGLCVRDANGKPLRMAGSISDIDARKRAEESRRMSEERYALAMQAAGDGHTDWNLATGEFYISPRLLEILGYAPDATYADRADWERRFPFHPEDRPKWEAAIAEHFAGREAKFKMDLRIVVNGETRWVAFTFIATRDASGKPVRWTGSIADINDAKLAEEARRLSEERYALAMRASGAGHWDWKIASDEFYASPRYLEFGGFPPDTKYSGRADIVSRIPFHPDDKAQYEAAVAAHFAGETPRVDMVIRVVPHGETRWLHVIGTCLRDAQGKPVRWAGSVTDITARKLAEEALRLSEKRYALAMEVADEGHFDWNVESDEFFASARALSVFGAPPEAKYRTRTELMAHVRYHPDDEQRLGNEWRTALDGSGVDHEFEYRILREAQEPRWIRSRWKIFRDEAGRALRVIGVIADITERKQAVETLRVNESRFRTLVELNSGGFWEQDENLRYKPSAFAHDITGYATDDRVGKTRWELCGDLTPLSQSWAEHQADLAARRPFRDFEYRRLRPDGGIGYYSASGAPIFDDRGRFKGYYGVASDITDRKRAEEEVRESEARFRALTGISSDWYWRQDEGLRFTYLSEGVSERAGWPGDDYIGRLRWEVADIHLISCTWDEHKEVLAKRQPFRDLEYWRPGKDGRIVYSSISGAPIFDEQGRFKGYHGVGRNITERKRIEEELRSRQDMLELAQKSARAVAFEWSIGDDGLYRNRWSAELAAMYGLAPDDRDGSFERWKNLIHREDWPAVKAAIKHALRTGDVDTEYRVVHRDGAVHWLQAKGRMFFDAAHKPVRMLGFLHDVTERKRVEEALRQSEERYALAVAGSNEGIFDWDLASDRVYVSHRAQELFGLARGELWRPRHDWRHILSFHPDDAPRLHDAIKAHIEGSAPTYDVEFRLIMPLGVRWYRQRGIALRDASGKAYRVVGSIGDVTEKHLTEEELRKLERKLRLAQRLEAMGTLAGGIAHDFNNILGAILGYGEMAQRDAPKGSRLARDLDSIIVAGERGRALVDRVLAFSRSSVGERVSVHVEKVVREALDLVSAKLPPDVTLHAKLHAGRAAMLGDATQVHQVVMNLASNAIQAMPSGGTLRVSLRPVRLESARAPTIGILDPGEYLVLEVADTGTGIAPEILDRIFDPFFTTKEVGTGTGLGLSLVHGIVSEVGGAIDVASKAGGGSTFTVYLPRSGDADGPSQKEESLLPRGDGQRVLIVDDEEPLVKLAARTLEELGYVPVGFTSSTAALAAFRAEPQRFHAVITDERMPGLSGSALIREVRGINSRIPVVLMSGYIGGAVASGAREAGAEEVLKKPLSARDLATSLARVLHA
jgi:PAS domain S-box-containing protein